MMAAATEQTKGAQGPREILETIWELIRLWFIPVFSAGVLLYTMGTLPIPYAAAMPDGHKWFWGVLLIISGFYAVRETRDMVAG